MERENRKFNQSLSIELSERGSERVSYKRIFTTTGLVLGSVLLAGAGVNLAVQELWNNEVYQDLPRNFRVATESLMVGLGIGGTFSGGMALGSKILNP